MSFALNRFRCRNPMSYLEVFGRRGVSQTICVRFNASSFPNRGLSDDEQELTDPTARELLGRQFIDKLEIMDARQAQQLSVTLSEYNGSRWHKAYSAIRTVLNPGWHYLYHNELKPESALSSDGYDLDQSPGGDWTRRMWAGGEIVYPSVKAHHQTSPPAFGWYYRQKNAVENIKMKGTPGGADEKMFVTFRRLTSSRSLQIGAKHERHGVQSFSRLEDFKEPTIESECAIVERRIIVYMKGNSEKVPVSTRVVKAPHTPDFYNIITPTSTLLFRFSALTSNSHKIHIDGHYVREVEKLPDLVCHGPLLNILLLDLLRVNIIDTSGMSNYVGHGSITNLNFLSWSYKNLAPLYVDRPIKLCARKVDDLTYELWAETPEGGYAVKGTAKLQRMEGQKIESCEDWLAIRKKKLASAPDWRRRLEEKVTETELIEKWLKTDLFVKRFDERAVQSKLAMASKSGRDSDGQNSYE